jgi:D-glycero-D-manno-heptose 1,7-bisphosphate phosphatase
VENYVAGFLSQIQSTIARMFPAEIRRIVDVHLILRHAISTSLRKPRAVGAENAMAHEAWATEWMPAGGERARAVFIDRDGVINENRSDYVKSWDEFKFLDGSFGALARLAPCKLKVVIVSNQSAIGRQHVSREMVEDIHRRMVHQIEQSGGRVDRVLYCPHHPDENCGCRKPKPGLLEQAGREFELDLTRSYVIGDALEDLQAGWNVGCQTLLVRTGRGAESIRHLDRQNGSRPVVVDDLKGAVEWILEREALARMDGEHAKVQAVHEFAR